MGFLQQLDKKISDDAVRTAQIIAFDALLKTIQAALPTGTHLSRIDMTSLFRLQRNGSSIDLKIDDVFALATELGIDVPEVLR